MLRTLSPMLQGEGRVSGTFIRAGYLAGRARSEMSRDLETKLSMKLKIISK